MSHFRNPAPGRRHLRRTSVQTALEESTRVPAGEGAVQILPCAEGRTGLKLHGQAHIALILLATHSLRRFLAAAYDSVPAGDEHRLLDLDTALAGLLNETP